MKCDDPRGCLRPADCDRAGYCHGNPFKTGGVVLSLARAYEARTNRPATELRRLAQAIARESR